MDEITRKRIQNVLPLLDERQRRLYLANEAKSLGRGGITWLSRVSGVSRVTITAGMKEINQEGYESQASSRSRKEGGGRKMKEEENPEILEMLERFLEPHTKGDPENPLKWTSKSTRKLEKCFAEQGYTISDTTIGEILKSQGYSLQSNRKDFAIKPSHPDRNAQFEHTSLPAGR